MLNLIVFLVLLVLGTLLLEKVFKVRNEDTSLMYAGALLIAAVQVLAVIITLIVDSGFTSLLVGPTLNLVLNSLLGIYLLKKSKAI